MPATKRRRRAPAKKTTTKKATPVVVRRKPLIEQLHPGILKTALQHAKGDASKVEVISPTNVTVRL